MHKKKLKSIFGKYLIQRNNRIIKLHRRGKSLKWLARKFDLTGRHINRILILDKPRS